MNCSSSTSKRKVLGTMPTAFDALHDNFRCRIRPRSTESTSIIEEALSPPSTDLCLECSPAAAAAAVSLSSLSLSQQQQRESNITAEMNRLQALKTFSCLMENAGEDPALQRFTDMAARICGMPYAKMSLVDMTTIDVLASTGCTIPSQIPRRGSMCAQVVCNTMCSSNANDNDLCYILTDTALHPRISQAMMVQSPPYVRFFAGVPLVSPDGYKIGCLCVMDHQPHSTGLSIEQQLTLRDLAETAMRILVDRRYRMQMHEQKEHMLACTSHDVMTPLTGLKLSLSLLQDDLQLQAKLDDGQRELFLTASSCADVMTRIFQATIDTLRGMSSAKIFPEKLGSLRKLSDLVHCLYKVMAPIPKQVPVIIDVSPDAPDTIAVDDLKVFRATLNILSTACARTTEGYVQLRIYPRYEDNTSEVIFECHDTAPALDPADQIRVFQAYDSEELHEPVLMSIRYAAQMLSSVQGKLGWRPRTTAEGGGSVFWFSIPHLAGTKHKSRAQTVTPLTLTGLVDSPTNASIVPLSSQQPISDSKTVVSSSSSESSTSAEETTVRRALVVDDSAVIRKILSRSLHQLGYTVSCAEDGMQGLEKLKEYVYDIVLLDFLMPVMDGMDCVKQFREWEQVHRRGPRQFILGISAHASESDSRKGIKAGMDAYEPKPVSMQTLKTIIAGREESLKESHEQEENGRMSVSSLSSQERECKRSYHENYEEECDKKKRLSPCMITKRHCLITTLDKSMMPASIDENWQCEHVPHDKALELLKVRNWDAVVMDLAGVEIMKQFRIWESHNRIRRQNNVFLLASVPFSSSCLVHPPAGMDGVLQPTYENFLQLVERNDSSKYVISQS